MPSTKTESIRYRWDAKQATTSEPGTSTYVTTFTSAVDMQPSGFVNRGDSPRNWRQRIAKGLGATSTLDGQKVSASVSDTGTATRIDRRNSTGNIRTTVLRGSVGMVDSLAAMPSLNSSLRDSAILAARTKFAKRCLHAQQKVQSLVSVGEIGQTVRMIRRLAGVLHHGAFDYLASLKKRRKRRKRQGSPRERRRTTTQLISETWLEYSFGWQPLVNDIHGLAEGLATANVRAAAQFETVTASRQLDAASPAVISVQNHLISGWNRFQTTEVGQVKWNASARFKGAVNLQPPGTNAITNQLGLRLRDIVPTLWELIPYSFAVDYFTNVGDIIALNSLRQCDLRWVELGWACDSMRTHQLQNVTGPPNGNYTMLSTTFSAPSMATLSNKQIHREQYVGTLVPPLQFSIPGLKQALNLGALLGASRRTSSELSSY
jgi:hypothetical protein